MTELEFLEVIKAHPVSETRLEGPVHMEGEASDSSSPFDFKYCIYDRTDCPLWLYYFTEEDGLQRASSVYPEGGITVLTGALGYRTVDLGVESDDANKSGSPIISGILAWIVLALLIA